MEGWEIGSIVAVIFVGGWIFNYMVEKRQRARAKVVFEYHAAERHCLACQHCENNWPQRPHLSLCRGFRAENHSLVSGLPEKIFCEHERRDGGRCGVEGKFWVRRDS